MAKMFQGNTEKVRELCRQLKPLFGEKVEQLFQAYCAEDEKGKELIESYLERLQAKYLPVAVDTPSASLVPPAPHQAYGEYEIGPILYAGKEVGTFGLREHEWIQHVGIFGRTGAGKTNLGFLILQQLIRARKPILVFDWKRNYRDLLARAEFKDMQVYTIGRPIAPFTFNPLIPPPGTNPKTWLKKLNEVIAHAYLLGNGVLYLLQQTLDEAYEEAGVYSGQVETWPTFQDMLAKARKLNVRGREAGWLSSTLRALASLCFGDMGQLVNQQHADSPEELLDKTVILELDALTQQDKVFFASALLLWIHHYRMQEATREQFKHAILIEEAHHILSGERRSLVGGQSVMEITFREIREFGESLILLDQHPSQISLPALGNTYATICLNLKHSKDVNAMSQCMLLQDKEKDILGSLEVGQAVVKLQGRLPRPFLIQIPEFSVGKGKVTDLMIGERIAVTLQNSPALPESPGLADSGFTGQAPLPRDTSPFLAGTAIPVLPRKAATEPHETEKRLPDSESPHGESLELRFVKDVRDYPDSGIAARYKRLGISVRQGQKLKAYLAADGLIEEQEERTPTGKLLRIGLTEKARQLLREHA